MFERSRIPGMRAALLAVTILSLSLPMVPNAIGMERRADTASVERIVEIGREHNRAARHLKHLANRIGARPAGTRAHHETAEWLLDKFEDFGLANVHLEWAGDYPADRDAEWAKGLLGGLVHVDDESGAALVPLYNVVADIPGTSLADEYVIVGAHYDAVAAGDGALDNGTGVAAALEAARILVESGARPQRTIRFILFAGEEAGLIGSTAWVDSHPDLLPRISAMYNMDLGTHYISGIGVTESMKDDMEAIFAPVTELDPKMPFAITVGEGLATGESGMCRVGMGGAGCASVACGGGGGDGPTPMVMAFKKQEDGSLVPIEGAGSEEMGRIIEKLDLSGGSPTDGPVTLGREELQAMGLLPEGAMGEGQAEFKVLAFGTSDHSPFLDAGVPGFWWTQQGDESVEYPAHSARDTWELVIPRYLEHSATVIALGAFGTANLPHLLSRDTLTTLNAGDATPGIMREIRIPGN